MKILIAAFAFCCSLNVSLAAASPEPWHKLSSSEQEALAPVQSQWSSLSEAQQRNFLDIAHHYPDLNPSEKQRFLGRLATWAKLKVAEGSWNLFLAPEQQSQVEPLLFTEAVPNEIFCVTSDFFKKYPRETMKVVAALLSYINMPENRNLIDQLFRMDYFVPAYNTDFSKLRAMVKRVESKLK